MDVNTIAFQSVKAMIEEKSEALQRADRNVLMATLRPGRYSLRRHIPVNLLPADESFIATLL